MSFAFKSFGFREDLDTNLNVDICFFLEIIDLRHKIRNIDNLQYMEFGLKINNYICIYA